MLDQHEAEQLVKLLAKMEWPLPQEVFHALMAKVVSVPIELAVFNEDYQVLMIWRDDWEFKGWHMPGTVLRDTEDVAGALKRLIKGEVGDVVTSTPRPLPWLEFGREGSTRHEISLPHLCSLKGLYKGRGKFFDPRALPSDTLEHHKTLVAHILKYAAL